MAATRKGLHHHLPSTQPHRNSIRKSPPRLLPLPQRNFPPPMVRPSPPCSEYPSSDESKLGPDEDLEIDLEAVLVGLSM